MALQGCEVLQRNMRQVKSYVMLLQGKNGIYLHIEIERERERERENKYV